MLYGTGNDHYESIFHSYSPLHEINGFRQNGDKMPVRSQKIDTTLRVKVPFERKPVYRPGYTHQGVISPAPHKMDMNVGMGRGRGSYNGDAFILGGRGSDPMNFGYGTTPPVPSGMSGLEKSFLKKAASSVKKAVGTVAKVAVAPIAQSVATSLDAVGMRNAANKVIDKTAISKKIGTAQKKAANYGGWAIDAAALTIGGVVAAPYIGAAASTVGGATLKGAALLKSGGAGLLGKGVGIVKGLIGPKPKQEASAPGAAPVDAGETFGSQIGDALKKGARKFGSNARNILNSSAGDVVDTSAVDSSGRPFPVGPSTAPSYGSSSPSADTSQNPLMTEASAAGFDLKNPVVIIGGLAAIGFAFYSQRPKTRRRRSR